MTDPKARPALVAAAGLLLFALFVLLSGVNPVMVDDTLITFTYVRNWVDHGVLTWWPDAPMVDGFTSLGHVLLLATAYWAGADILTANITLNLGALALIAAGVLRATRDLGALAQITGLVVILLNASAFFWFAGGLDGLLYAALFLWTYLSFEQAERTGRFRWTTAALLIATAATRPEALFIATAIVLFYWTTRAAGRPRDGHQILWPTVVLLGVAGLVAWRIWTYGHPAPNTYYAKASASRMAEVQAGLDYLWLWISRQGGFILTLTPLALLLGSRAWLRATFVTGIVGIAIVSGGDPHPMARFLPPVIPLIALDAAWLVAHTSRLGRLSALTLLLPYLWVQTAPSLPQVEQTGTVVTSAQRIMEGRWPYHSYRDDRLMRLLEPAIKDLDEALQPNLPILGTDVGALAYFSNRWVRDAAGLNDPDLAHMPKPEGVANEWGIWRVDTLAQQGVPVALPYFTAYDTWTWASIATGQRACPDFAARRLQQVSSGPDELTESYLCGSLASQRVPGYWVNVFVHSDYGEAAFRDPSQVTLSQCLPAVRSACGY